MKRILVVLGVALLIGAAPGASLEPRVAALEATVANLQARVTVLEGSPTASPTPTPIASPWAGPLVNIRAAFGAACSRNTGNIRRWSSWQR